MISDNYKPLQPELTNQNQLVSDAIKCFGSHEDAIAGVLVGSLSSGNADRVSDADILFIFKNEKHLNTDTLYQSFEKNKDIFYQFSDKFGDEAVCRKYLFHDMTSAEIHCIGLDTHFPICHPHQVLFDKEDVLPSRITSEPAPKHEDFPVFPHGNKGLTWELFECIKWLSRDKSDLAKNYIKKLALKL